MGPQAMSGIMRVSMERVLCAETADCRRPLNGPQAAKVSELMGHACSPFCLAMRLCSCTVRPRCACTAAWQCWHVSPSLEGDEEAACDGYQLPPDSCRAAEDASTQGIAAVWHW